jgi:hypothetical protein
MLCIIFRIPDDWIPRERGIYWSIDGSYTRNNMWIGVSLAFFGKRVIYLNPKNQVLGMLDEKDTLLGLGSWLLSLK